MATGGTKPTEKVINLAFPFEHDGAQIGTVTLRRAKGRDLCALDEAEKGNKLEAAMTLAARLCGLPFEAMMEMDAEDVTTVMEQMEDFFPKGAAPGFGGP